MENLLTLGWREWVSLPELELKQIKAKVDTGARTSALHAFKIETYVQDGVEFAMFHLHPNQRDQDTIQVCVAPIIDRRTVRDSGGHSEDRLVIETPVTVGSHTWPIEITLTSRDDMLFRMLIGRNAIKNRALVDSSRSYLVGKKRRKKEKDNA